MVYYKWLDANNTGGYSGWEWPTELGKWLPDVEGDLEVCRRGYHVIREQHIPEWIPEENYLAMIKAARRMG